MSCPSSPCQAGDAGAIAAELDLQPSAMAGGGKQWAAGGSSFSRVQLFYYRTGMA